MALSSSTVSLLSALDTISANTLARRSDLGTLIELGSAPGVHEKLEELSFYAKFVDRAHKILERIGRGGEGYDRLAAEFAGTMEKAVALLTTMIDTAPPEVRAHFATAYFAMTQEAVAGLLELFHDLAWYKNWLLDERQQHRGSS